MKDKRILITGGSGFIGTHLIDNLVRKGAEVLNVDIVAPKVQEQNSYWVQCNILDSTNLNQVLRNFQPDYLVHLAARATTEGRSLDDYRDNTVGTANVLQAIKKTKNILRVVITSSQHVRKPGSGFPKDDEDFIPHGLYGQSKAISEKLTREAGLISVWTIIRPTTVWGAWHPFLPDGLWHLMIKKRYFHPKDDSVVRNYGYVRNVVWQIEQILQAPSQVVDKKVYYLGDPSIRQIDWINAFSKALSQRDVPLVPKGWIHALAYSGDALRTLGVRFPMDSARYFNLTTTNPVPINPTFESFGMPPYCLDDGVQETVEWLRESGRM